MTPVGRCTRGIHEGKLELAGAGIVGAVDGDLALMADDAWHLRGGRQGGQPQREEEEVEFGFHVIIS